MEETKANLNSGVYYKDLGNERFKAGDYQAALANYTKAIVNIRQRNLKFFVIFDSYSYTVLSKPFWINDFICFLYLLLNILQLCLKNNNLNFHIKFLRRNRFYIVFIGNR